MVHFYVSMIHKKKLPVAFTAIVMLCIAYSGYTQTDYSFENLTVEQGLADRLINAVTRDAQGYIWIASNEGLTKYDGYTCTVYRHKANDRHSLSDNEVYTLCTDNEGTLWAGTQKGLNRYDAQNNQFDVFRHDSSNDNSITGDEIFSLAKDASGNIWIGTLDGGMDMMEKIKSKTNNALPVYRFIHYRHRDNDSNTISDNRIRSVAFDNRQNVWIGTAAGLNILNREDGKFMRFYRNEKDKFSVSNNFVHKIYKDANGDMWLCGKGMLDRVDVNFFYRENKLRANHFLTSLDSFQSTKDWVVNDFLTDNSGNAWIATNDNGLIKYSTDKTNQFNSFQQFTGSSKPNSLVNSTVYCLYEDSSGLTWIGTAKGVSKYIPSKAKFNEAGNINDLLPKHKNFVMALLADHQNRLWVGYDSDTLSLIAGINNRTRSARNIILTPSIQGDQVNTIFQSRRGDIYIGTLLKGLYIIPFDPLNVTDKSKWIHIDAKQNTALPSNNIYAVAEDAQSMIWIGTYTGLCMYNPGTRLVQQVYASSQKKITAAHNIRSIVIDKQNIIWCGTSDGIYCIEDGEVIQSFKSNEQDSTTVSSDRITSFMIDHNQNIWTGTREGGINMYDIKEKKFHRFTTNNGLSNDGIRSIKEDNNNNIWIATDHGLSRFDIADKKIYNYTAADGLHSDQFIVNAVTEDSSGIFYFGTNNGLISFRPENIIPNAFIPPLVITDIKIFNTPIAALKDSSIFRRYKQENNIVLDYNQNFFSFEFAALNYINSAANRYSYMLEGIDKSWNEAGTKRFAGYTDIKPGTYIFKVKGSNNDGLWNEVPATVTIIITAPWWQTWWFYALCAIAISTVIYLIYRVRLSQILKLYKLRSSIAKDLHDDVGSALSSIALLSNIAQSGKTNAQLQPEEIFSRIGNTSKRMIDLMDDIVWSVNPDNDRFSNMLIRMREYAAEMLETKNIAFTFRVSENIDELKLPMQMRKDYFLIFKEAVNNLTKYAGASNAAITIEKQNSYIITTIQDDGNGFDPNIIHSGNGLKNMHARAGNIKGILKIVTGNNGTTVTLTTHVT
jgi:ligand-binding sensor domain-containing protein/two-component sensor histidine kinase